MRVLSLDISSHAGYAVVDKGGKLMPDQFSAEAVREDDDARFVLVDYGVVENKESVASFGEYPMSLYRAAHSLATRLAGLITKHKPEVIVIEETNLGKNRYSQKLLEYTHALLLSELENHLSRQYTGPVVYLDTSAWRHALGLRLDKDQKKQNARLSKAKRNAAELGRKLDKKALGIKGKVTWKHLSVEHANSFFSLSLKQKDNDIADAINLALAFFNDAEHCEGF